MEICRKKNCTGCGACSYVCPKDCITMEEDSIGMINPVIDEAKCIRCNICKRVCPQLNKIKCNRPIKAYAAWSSDVEERRTSASGGIAAEIYKYAAQNGILFSGAVIREDLSVELMLTNDILMLPEFKNSKYVFSTAYKLYPQIKKALNEHQKMIIVGMPCQIAAIKNTFKNPEQIIFVDLVCHGMTPLSYLWQHVYLLNKELKVNATKISFRDPEVGTEKFFLSLFDAKGEKIYSKRTSDGDTYQYGYHRMISYRENCYHCIYAKAERISDITLSDYKGLGTLKPCGYDEKNVSCILINTEKGQELVDKLINSKKINAEERPVDEPIRGDKQLQHPSLKGSARNTFEKYIFRSNGNFEKTMKIVINREKMRRYLGVLKRKILK